MRSLSHKQFPTYLKRICRELKKGYDAKLKNNIYLYFCRRVNVTFMQKFDIRL